LISPEALLLALRSAWNPSSLESTPETVMKLAKKNDQAVLSFDISGSMSSGRLVRVGHDVRIEVMKPSDVKRLSEPMCPEPDVHILLPPLQKLRTIVERLRPLSDVIAVRCNNNGKLEISVQTEGVRVDTQWSGCTNPKMAQEGASQNAEAGGEIEKPDPDQLFLCADIYQEFYQILEQPRPFEYDHCLHLPRPLRDFIRLHRGLCRCRRRSHFLHSCTYRFVRGSEGVRGQRACGSSGDVYYVLLS